ncbi:MAG: hypothetical protein K0R31_1704, partial [Clostridiales bacterium]|nr:hypothetical protein [Clostridiales bacterium]
LKGMAELGKDTDEIFIRLKRDIDQLKSEYEKSCINNVKDKIQATQSATRILKSGVLIVTALSVLLLIFGIYVSPSALIFGAAILLAGVPLTYFLFNKKKVLNQLQKEKKEASNYRFNLLEQITQKQKTLEDIQKKAGVQSFEEIFRSKALYDDKVQSLASLNNELMCLDSERLSNLQKISVLKNKAFEMLISSGIVDMDQFKDDSDPYELSVIKEEYIKGFAAGISKYKELEPEISYTSKRRTDLKGQLKVLYSRAQDLCKKEISRREMIIEEIKRAEIEVSQLENQAQVSLQELVEHCRMQQDGKDYEETIINRLKNPGDLFLSKTLNSEYDAIKYKINNTMLKIRENETILKSLADDEKLQKIEEEIENLEQNKSGLEDIDSSLKIAIEVLTEAGTEIQKDFAPALNESMSSIIGKITGGKYQDLRADDSLSLKVLVPDTGDIVTSSILSGGTIDQLYLALRISMDRLIAARGESLPFIMDEILAQYDDERALMALDYLKEISKDRQILFFTCKKREVELANEIYGNSLNLISLA